MCFIYCFHIEIRKCNLRSNYKQELCVCVCVCVCFKAGDFFFFFYPLKVKTANWDLILPLPNRESPSVHFVLWWLQWWMSLAFWSPSLPFLEHSRMEIFVFSTYVQKALVSRTQRKTVFWIITCIQFLL